MSPLAKAVVAAQLTSGSLNILAAYMGAWMDVTLGWLGLAAVFALTTFAACVVGKSVFAANADYWR